MKKVLLITAGLIWAAATLPFTALTGPAHADTLSGGRADIDAWITTLGGITLSNQPVPSEFPNKLKTSLEEAAVHEQGRCRPGRSLYPPADQQAPAYSQGEDRLRPKHRMPSRPRKNRRSRKAGPVDDRRPGVDQRLQGLQAVGGQAQGKARGKGSAIAGVHGGWEKMGELLRSPWERRLMLQHVAHPRSGLPAGDTDVGEVQLRPGRTLVSVDNEAMTA